MRFDLRAILCAVALVCAGAVAAVAQTAAPRATIETSLGNIVIELDAEHAPATVANFVRYAREGHFDGTVIYRVVPGFVIQAGSVDAKGDQRNVHDAIQLETANAASNARGAIAMARANEPASGTADFLINLAANGRALDRQSDDHANM